MGIFVLSGIVLLWVALVFIALVSFAHAYKRFDLTKEPISKSIPLAALASLLGPGILSTHALAPAPLFVSLLFYIDEPMSKAMILNVGAFVVMCVLCLAVGIYIRQKSSET
jgi:hypothetical protein